MWTSPGATTSRSCSGSMIAGTVGALDANRAAPNKSGARPSRRKCTVHASVGHGLCSAVAAGYTMKNILLLFALLVLLSCNRVRIAANDTAAQSGANDR